MHDVVMGLIGLAITLLGALVVSVWRFSALATTLNLTVHELKEDLAEVRRMLDQVKEIPVIQRDIATLKDALAKLTSWFPKQDSRLSVLEERVFSLKGFRARLESVHDVGDDEK